MKKHVSALLILAATAGFAAAQTTAATTPVGYVTVDVPANSDTTISASALTRPPLYIGASTSISGDDVGASGLTSGAFVSPACYLKVSSGPLEGMIFPITANSDTTITVDAGDSTLQDLGFVSGNTFQVIPFWTLNTLFPNGAGVGGTSSVLAPESFVLVSDSQGLGINRGSSGVYFYCTGDEEFELPAGWYDNSNPFAGTIGDNPLDPTIQYSVRSSGTASQVVISGVVPAVQHNTQVVQATETNDNYLGAPFPVDISLQESGLQSVIQATDSVLAPTEFVFIYDDLATGLNKPAAQLFFYCSGDAEFELPAGWYDNANPFAGVVTDKVLKAGRAFVLRKSNGESVSALDWVAPLPYSLE